MTDLVEKLRSCPGKGDPECYCEEAADEIEKLRAERDELDRQLTNAWKTGARFGGEIDQLRKELDAWKPRDSHP